MADIKIEWLIAAAMALGLAAILATGQIRLWMGPPSWHRVDRQKDASRYWAFVTAVTLAIAVLILSAMPG